MTLRRRLFLGLNGLILVTAVLVAGPALFTTVRGLRESARGNALATASLLASAAEMAARAPGEFAVQDLVDRVIHAGDLEAVFVVGGDRRLESPDDGDLIKEYYRDFEPMALETIRMLGPAAQFRNGSVVASVPLIGRDGRAGALVCKFDTERLDEAIASSLRDVVLLGAAGLIAGGLLSGVMARRVSGPVQQLADGARVVGSGGFEHRVKVASDDEVGQLARAFNAMADSLERYTLDLAHATAEREALRREMDIAADIQRSLLPGTCPEVEHFDTAAQSLPAREVGGDFYDFVPLPEGRWGAVVADVAGKGVPAALLMTLSRSLIRAYSHERPSILQALEQANRFMLRDMDSGTFVTCFYGVIDPAQGKLTYVNAGHNPAVVVRSDGGATLLRASGTPLGILEQSDMAEETCELGVGDVVLIYTDGITEARNAYGEQFGLPRLQDLAKNARGLGAAEICERVMTAARTFTGGQPGSDDMTTVVLKAR